jgi:hypothetical protein
VQHIGAETTEAAGPVKATFRECLRRNSIAGEWRMVEGGSTGHGGAACAQYGPDGDWSDQSG